MSKERPDETATEAAARIQELGNPGAPECPACKVRSSTTFCPYCGKRLKPPSHGEFLANHCRSNVKRLETQAKNQEDMAAGAPANKMDKDECAEKADRYLHLADQWKARARWVENIIRQRVNAPLFEGPPPLADEPGEI